MSDVESQDQKQLEQGEEKKSSPRTPGHASLWMATTIALVIALIAAIMVVVGAQNDQRIGRDVAAQGKDWQKIQQRQQQFDEQLAQQQQSLHGVMASVEQQHLSGNKDQTGAVLAEVNYLVRLAYYNAQYQGDPKIVLALLETAERRLSALASPQWVEVRTALVNDITAIKGVKAVDIEGVSLRLNALSDAIAELTVMEPVALTSTKTVEETQASTAGNTWKDKLFSSLDALKKVVVVRHLAEPIQPLIAPDQQANLVNNIQSKLMLAQWALLHRTPKIYSASLSQAKVWLGRYFMGSEAMRGVVTGLDELEKIDINPALPDLSATVGIIDRAMQTHQASEGATLPSNAVPPGNSPSSGNPSGGSSSPSDASSSPSNTPSPGSPSSPSDAPSSGSSPSSNTPSSEPQPAPVLVPSSAPSPATPPKAKLEQSAEPLVISS